MGSGTSPAPAEDKDGLHGRAPHDQRGWHCKAIPEADFLLCAVLHPDFEEGPSWRNALLRLIAATPRHCSRSICRTGKVRQTWRRSQFNATRVGSNPITFTTCFASGCRDNMPRTLKNLLS